MARKPKSPDSPPSRRMRGFEAAGGLMARRIQTAGESRGFAVTRLLTHWPEVAGPELAAITRPVKVGYSRDGFGAALTVLVSPAHAPMVEMQKERLRERVNSVYGFNAISRIHLTQTASTGFAEGQADFTYRTQAPTHDLPEPTPEARAVVGEVGDSDLKRALDQLAQNVLARRAAKDAG